MDRLALFKKHDADQPPALRLNAMEMQGVEIFYKWLTNKEEYDEKRFQQKVKNVAENPDGK